MKKDKKDKKEKELELEKKVVSFENTKRTIKILLMVLAGIVLCACCFGAGYLGRGLDNFEDKVTNEENNEEKEQVNDEEDLDVQLETLTVDSEVVKKLFEKFREDQNCTYADLVEELETSIEAKRYVAYLQLAESNFSEKTCGSLSVGNFKHGFAMFVCGENDQAYQYANNDDWIGFHKVIANEKVIVFSASELKSKVQEMFGQNIDYSDNSFSISDGLFAYYDKNNNLYAKFYCYNCGGECGMSRVHTLESIEQDGTTLKLYTILTDEDEMGFSSSDVVYTFEYEKETGNYIFVSRDKK